MPISLHVFDLGHIQISPSSFFHEHFTSLWRHFSPDMTSVDLSWPFSSSCEAVPLRTWPFFISTFLCSRATWKHPLPVIPVFYTLASQDWASGCFCCGLTPAGSQVPHIPVWSAPLWSQIQNIAPYELLERKLTTSQAKSELFSHLITPTLPRLTTSSPWLLDDETSKGPGIKDWDTIGFEALRRVLRLCGCVDADGDDHVGCQDENRHGEVPGEVDMEDISPDGLHGK